MTLPIKLLSSAILQLVWHLLKVCSVWRVKASWSPWKVNKRASETLMCVICLILKIDGFCALAALSQTWVKGNRNVDSQNCIVQSAARRERLPQFSLALWIFLLRKKTSIFPSSCQRLNTSLSWPGPAVTSRVVILTTGLSLPDWVWWLRTTRKQAHPPFTKLTN